MFVHLERHSSILLLVLLWLHLLVLTRCSPDSMEALVIDEGNQHTKDNVYCGEFGGCMAGTHVMCMYAKGMGHRCTEAKELPLNTEERKHMLDILNELKRNLAHGAEAHLPKAYGMRKLFWDSTLATFAQAWANQCDADRLDLCRCTEQDRKVGQTLISRKFNYPDWSWLGTKTNVNYTKEMKKNIKMPEHIKKYIIEEFAKAIYTREVTSVEINKFPGGGYRNPYLIAVNGENSRVGCGISSYLVYYRDFDENPIIYRQVEIVCDFAIEPTAGDSVYVTKWVEGADWTPCGCPEGFREEECLCIEAPEQKTDPPVTELPITITENTFKGTLITADIKNYTDPPVTELPITITEDTFKGTLIMANLKNYADTCGKACEPHVVILPIIQVVSADQPRLANIDGSIHVNKISATNNKHAMDQSDDTHRRQRDFLRWAGLTDQQPPQVRTISVHNNEHATNESEYTHQRFQDIKKLFDNIIDENNQPLPDLKDQQPLQVKTTSVNDNEHAMDESDGTHRKYDIQQMQQDFLSLAELKDQQPEQVKTISVNNNEHATDESYGTQRRYDDIQQSQQDFFRFQDIKKLFDNIIDENNQPLPDLKDQQPLQVKTTSVNDNEHAMDESDGTHRKYDIQQMQQDFLSLAELKDQQPEQVKTISVNNNEHATDESYGTQRRYDDIQQSQQDFFRLPDLKYEQPLQGQTISVNNNKHATDESYGTQRRYDDIQQRQQDFFRLPDLKYQQPLQGQTISVNNNEHATDESYGTQRRYDDIQQRQPDFLRLADLKYQHPIQVQTISVNNNEHATDVTQRKYDTQRRHQDFRQEIEDTVQNAGGRFFNDYAVSNPVSKLPGAIPVNETRRKYSKKNPTNSSNINNKEAKITLPDTKVEIKASKDFSDLVMR